MQYSELHGTDLTASKIVLGTDMFGTNISEQDSFALMDAYINAGGNVIDTASIYADWLGKGKSISERTIGKWLRDKNRSQIILVTKGGCHDLTTLQSRVNIACIKEDLKNSLSNLQTDYIDIYYLHKDDISQSAEAIIEMFNEAVPESSAHYLGVSNWSYERIARANAHAAAHGLRPVIASQIKHSIACTNFPAYGIVEMNETDYAGYFKDSLNVFAFSSQAKGFFAILDEKGETALPESVRAAYLNDRNLKMYDTMKNVSREKNVPVSSLVTAALLADSHVNTFAQIGPHTMAELDASLAAADVSLTREEALSMNRFL